MAEAVLAFGTNLGDRMENLNCAVRAAGLLCGTKLVRASRVYETDPVGYESQPDFLNCAAVFETDLSPHALLGACLGIEAALGRLRGVKNGPRLIDVDLLLYEGMRIDEPELMLPHPRMLERGFVLRPLLDLYPEGVACGVCFRDAPGLSGGQGVRLFAKELRLAE